MTRIVVVGAGPAGLAAAVAASRARADVVLVDEGERVGGQFWRNHPQLTDQRLQHQRGRFAELTAALADERTAVRVMSSTSVWRLEPGAPLRVHTLTGPADGADRRGETLEADAIVLATGAHDRVLPVPGWTLPGVTSAGAVQALAKRDGVALGSRTVVAGAGPFLLPVAQSVTLLDAEYQAGKNVEVITMPVDDLWARDTVPVFVEGADGVTGVDFNFNGWGDKQEHANDALVGAALLEELGIPRLKANLVAEGGSLETDGLGTLFVTESSIVNDNRNPGLSRDEIEARLMELLGMKKVIWFDGVYGEDITDAHIDSLVRFVAPGVANGAVFVPEFGDKAADREAQDILAEQFPDREIVPVAIDTIASGGGGIHCATHDLRGTPED